MRAKLLATALLVAAMLAPDISDAGPIQRRHRREREAAAAIERAKAEAARDAWYAVLSPIDRAKEDGRLAGIAEANQATEAMVSALNERHETERAEISMRLARAKWWNAALGGGLVFSAIIALIAAIGAAVQSDRARD